MSSKSFSIVESDGNIDFFPTCWVNEECSSITVPKRKIMTLKKLEAPLRSNCEKITMKYGKLEIKSPYTLLK